MNPQDEARAKELFESYDGSTFFMSRDGFEDEYMNLNVPSETEAAWLRDMTARKLATLGRPGSWSAVSFLRHHSDFAHVAEVVAAEPQGNGSDQLTYLREVLDYVDHAARRGVLRQTQVDEAVGVVTDRALAIAKRWPAARDQVEALVRQAVALGGQRDFDGPPGLAPHDIRER